MTGGNWPMSGGGSRADTWWLRAALLTAAVLLATSCLTGGGEKGKTPSAKGEGERQRPKPIEVEGDIDFSTAPYRELLYTPPQDGQPIFFAAVPRRADRDDEYEAGIGALAAQAARWKRAKITAKFLTKKSGREMGYLEEVEVAVSRERQEKLREDVEVLIWYRDRAGSYFRGTLSGERQKAFGLKKSPAGTKPDWIVDPPEYGGYRTAVGAANRHMYLSESLGAADEQAMANLARQFHIEVERKRLDLEQSAGTAYTQYNIQRSEAVLSGVYVMDRWISPDGNSYYALAVVPEEQ